MRKWYRLTRVQAFGVPIYVHWSVLAMVAVLLALSFESPLFAAVGIASYLGIIAIHELGHAFAARRLGYIVESISISFVHGTCKIERPEKEWEHVIFAWAGVLTQLAIAVPVLIIASIFRTEDIGYLRPAVMFLGYANLLFALLNLAPSTGFDGQIAWRVIPLLLDEWKSKRETKKVIRSLGRRR